MDLEYVLQIIFQIVIIPLLTALTGVAVKWINSKANELKAKTENSYLQKYIDMLNDTITTAVVAVNQTYVDDLKDKNAFTKEAQVEALSRVYQTVIDSLTEESQYYLTEAVGDIEEYIKNKIEQEVSINKLSNRE